MWHQNQADIEVIKALEKALSALRKERDELKKDAARFRWLRDQTVTDDIGIAMKTECINGMLSNAENINQYIDAAMERGE